VRQATPDFKRFAVARGEALVVVDLVRDRVPQIEGLVVRLRRAAAPRVG
jgi:hypothetical protein